jgi:hypothetical protein
MVTKLPVPTKREYVITAVVIAAVVLAALAIDYLVGPTCPPC